MTTPVRHALLFCLHGRGYRRSSCPRYRPPSRSVSFNVLPCLLQRRPEDGISSFGRDTGAEIDALIAREPGTLIDYSRRAELGGPLVERTSMGYRGDQLFARGQGQSHKKKPRPPHIIETDPHGRQRIIHYHVPPRGRADTEDLLFGRMVEGYEIDELD